MSHNNVNDEFVSHEIGGGLIRAALFGALVAYRSAQRRMLEQWAESSEEKRKQLWQDLHACEAAATAAIEYVQGNGSPPHRPSQPQGDDALDAQSQAAIDVLAERKRQISIEGWAPEHDDEHSTGELARAAGAYALYAAASMSEHPGIWNSLHRSAAGAWPWDGPSKANTSTERRNLVKAGALILAEIERLDRAALASQENDQ